MPPKFDIKKAAAEALSFDIDEQRIRMLRALCKDRTNACYDRYFTMIQRFLDELKQPKLTKELFLRLITTTANQEICNANMLRAALLSYQKSHKAWLDQGESVWADDDDVILFCRGAMKIAHKNKRERGSITEDLFEQLLSHLQDSSLLRRFPDLNEAFLFIYITGIRFSQFIHYRSGDHIIEGCGKYILLRKDKRSSAGENETHTKLINDHQYNFILDLESKRNKPKGDILFTIAEAPVKEIRTFISEAATALAWPTDVDFDGPHCFRHGFTQKLIVETLRDRTQQCPTMIKYYARPNHERRILPST